MKFENKVAVTYANFCTNDYREIEWEESGYIYQSRFADSLHNPKKKYWTVPDRATIISFLLSPLSQISVDCPTGNQKGNIYYKFRWNDYKKYDSVEVKNVLYRVSSVIIPFTFKDSTKHYRDFVMEPVNEVDSVFAVWTSKIPQRIKKYRMSLEKFLEIFTPFLPFEKIDHSIIAVNKAKILYFNLFTGNNPFWKYQYEKPYFQYLCFYMYDTMRKKLKKKKVDMILARFTHSDGKKEEFSFDLSNPIFKEMYGYPFFFPIKKG